jgi:hypothetical protein
MRKFLYVLASTAILAMISPAVAQYVPPPAGAGGAPPGYMWREQRFNEDRRNNNAVQDKQLRENYERQRALNNATKSGSIGVTDPTKNYVGECAIGSS